MGTIGPLKSINIIVKYGLLHLHEQKDLILPLIHHNIIIPFCLFQAAIVQCFSFLLFLICILLFFYLQALFVLCFLFQVCINQMANNSNHSSKMVGTICMLTAQIKMWFSYKIFHGLNNWVRLTLVAYTQSAMYI